MSTENKFAVRTTKILSDEELRTSLKGGWDKELPAIQDEHGVLLVGNRRMKIAKEEGLEPVVKVVTFGSGPEADAARIRLANVSNIGGAPLAAEDRKRQAVRLYQNGGLTQQAIAHMLGVSQSTIRDDLRDLVVTTKSKHAKTTSNPRGAGRPKSSRTGSTASGRRRNKAITSDVEHDIAVAVLDEGKSLEVAVADAGVGSVQQAKLAVAYERGRREAEPNITPDMLSKTAQEKLDIAIRQHKRKFEAEFDQKVRERFREVVNDYLPELKTREKKANDILDRHKGIMPRSEFRKILACLESSQRKAVTDKWLDEAFMAVKNREHVLVARDKPIPEIGIVKTATDWEELRRQAKERRAKQSKQMQRR